MATKGSVVGVISNIVTIEADGPVAQNEICYITTGGDRLMAEVIKVTGREAYVQVFESTRGMKVGAEAEFTGHPLEVTLGPGMLSKNYDGLQNDLNKLTGVFLRRGEYNFPLDKEKKWGMTIGLRLDNKGMKTDARVKNYGMEIFGDGGERVAGNWTGQVKTTVSNSYLSLPVLATLQCNSRFRMHLGPYFSYMLDGDFSGSVYDGYLREGDPTGNKVVFEDGASATYDFSDDLRKFQWGAQLGVEWRAFSHLNVCADLMWGINDIFKKDFQTITFAMYPVYLNVGFGYAF